MKQLLRMLIMLVLAVVLLGCRSPAAPLLTWDEQLQRATQAATAYDSTAVLEAVIAFPSSTTEPDPEFGASFIFSSAKAEQITMRFPGSSSGQPSRTVAQTYPREPRTPQQRQLLAAALDTVHLTPADAEVTARQHIPSHIAHQKYIASLYLKLAGARLTAQSGVPAAWSVMYIAKDSADSVTIVLNAETGAVIEVREE